MNRVLGDYFENLLYQIFVSIDEHTTVSELANVLETDCQLVKVINLKYQTKISRLNLVKINNFQNVISMYCRLGFALKKGADIADNFHTSWLATKQNKTVKTETKDVEAFVLLLNSDTEGEILDCGTDTMSLKSPDEPGIKQVFSFIQLS